MRNGVLRRKIGDVECEAVMLKVMGFSWSRFNTSMLY